VDACVLSFVIVLLMSVLINDFEVHSCVCCDETVSKLSSNTLRALSLSPMNGFISVNVILPLAIFEPSLTLRR